MKKINYVCEEFYRTQRKLEQKEFLKKVNNVFLILIKMIFMFTSAFQTFIYAYIIIFSNNHSNIVISLLVINFCMMSIFCYEYHKMFEVKK